MSVQKPWSNLAQRLVTALILAAISLGLIWWGRFPFLLEVLLFGMAGSCEILDLLERKRLRPLRRTATLMTLMLLLATYGYGIMGLTCASLVGFLGILSLAVLRYQQRSSPILDAASTLLAVMYVGWFFSFLLLLRDLPQGAAWVTFLIALTTSTDAGAYFVGKALGRHPLCPVLSPKKTVEGSMGGLLLPAAVGAGLASWMGFEAYHGIVLGLGVSLLGQIGDLWESAMKREVGVKDAGELLGSHGGVLDRFDSLAFAVPFFYLYVWQVLK